MNTTHANEIARPTTYDVARWWNIVDVADGVPTNLDEQVTDLLADEIDRRPTTDEVAAYAAASRAYIAEIGR